MSNDTDIIWIASFDMGKKNFAFCIEEFHKSTLLSIKNIPSNSRYNENGTPTPKMTKILDSLCSNGKIILYKNLDLTENCNPKLKLDPETFHNMIDALDTYTEYWDKCSVFLIEEQMSFGKKLNKMAMKIGQHCYSYFTFKYGRYKTVIEFPAYHKTQILGAPKVEGKPYKSGKKRYKAMEKPQRKKWSVEKAIEILTSRGEMEILNTLKTAKKRDDLADVLVQLQAFKYRLYVDKCI
jgi:hypothetical protein